MVSILSSIRFALFVVFIATFAPVGAQSAQYIPAREYCRIACREIDNAKTSVHVFLYRFPLYASYAQSQPLLLANALVAAKGRGCSVNVILDKGDFSAQEGDPEDGGDNRNACEYLSCRGVTVGLAGGGTILHAKALIIDSTTVILGSANWSESGLGRNVEASALVRDAGVARAALRELGSVTMIAPPSPDTPSVHIPLGFLCDSLCARMVKVQDERAFDLYLHICKLAGPLETSLTSAETPSHGVSTGIIFNYDSAAAGLGIASMGSDAYRRQINKVLVKLQDQYRLVTTKTTFGRDAQIQVAKIPGETIAVSPKYWDWGWSRHLDFPGKVMYLLNQYYSARSLFGPQWSMAAPALADRHGLQKDFVESGTTSLRRANLVDVAYDSLPQQHNGQRHPNIYTPLALYDPVLLDKKWKELEGKYGKEKTDRGRRFAALVYKDCDAGAVKEFIVLEEKYGRDKMDAAAKIIGLKAPDNPRRSVGYFVRIVETM
jgi:PLD-like domain